MIEAEFTQQLSDSLDLLWRLGLYLTGDADQAGVLVEQVASLGLELRSTLPPGGRFETWLLALAVGTWQRGFAEPAGAQPFLEASVGDAYELTRAAGYGIGDDPAAEFGGRLEREDICRAFLRLSPRERAATALSLAADLSYDDLALILGVSRETVRARLRRGRAALKVALWEGRGVRCGG